MEEKENAAIENAEEKVENGATQPEATVPELAATNLLELIAAAEARGYKRGVDAAAKAKVESSKSVWEAPAANDCGTVDAGEEILKCIRPSVWD